MSKIMKKSTYYLLIIACSLVVIISAYVLKEVAPFGKHSLLTIDFFHQYGPMLGELYRRIYNYDTLRFSFNMGLGAPFYRNYFNYLSSPFNILLLFFKHKNLLVSYSVIIGLKAIASAVTMGIFFRWKFGEKKRFIPLCLLYAFSAYYIAYYWNVMWLDGMYMLPLIAMGIEQFIKEDKVILYIVSLSLMLYTNYFIGYMLCIFSVLYFIMYLVLTTHKFTFKKVFNKCFKFFIASLSVGIFCAFFLVPLFLSLKTISATGGSWPVSQYYDFTIREFLFSHFSGVTSTVLKSDGICSPNISCGIVSIGLLLLFLINNKISFKTKICYIIFLDLLIISFVVAPIDYIWHGMHVPNDLPYRYSFIYSFILMIMAGYSIINIEKIKPVYIAFVYVICMASVVLLKIINYPNINNTMIILNGVVLTVFYSVYSFYTSHKKWGKWLLAIMILTIVVERVMVLNNNWQIDQQVKDFISEDEQMNTIIHYLEHEEEDKFYRIEKQAMLTLNDSSWYGYHGMRSFSSMEYEAVAKLLFNLGISGNGINSFLYKINTPIFDVMFDVKYLIDKIDDNLQYVFYARIDDMDIYRNKYNLGLMYGVNKDIVNWEIIDNSPLLNQNNFIKYATNIDHVLTHIDTYETEIIYEGKDNQYIVKYKVYDHYDNYYLYFDNKENHIDFVVFDDNLYYFNKYYDYVYERDIPFHNSYDYNEHYVIANPKESDYFEFYVGYNYEVNETIDLYTFDMNEFIKAYNYLKGNKVEITTFKEDTIEGKINANSDYIIYTSIPYDIGWKVYVDDVKVPTFKVGDALLSFDVPKGEHTIKLKYRMSHSWICIFSGIILVVVYYMLFKNNKAKNI